MKTRLKDLAILTLAFLTLATLCLYGANKLTISMTALADNVSKTYLMSQPAQEYQAPKIEFSDKTTEEIEMEGR